jgi:hypothetical protein
LPKISVPPKNLECVTPHTPFSTRSLSPNQILVKPSTLPPPSSTCRRRPQPGGLVHAPLLPTDGWAPPHAVAPVKPTSLVCLQPSGQLLHITASSSARGLPLPNVAASLRLAPAARRHRRMRLASPPAFTKAQNFGNRNNLQSSH